MAESDEQDAPSWTFVLRRYAEMVWATEARHCEPPALSAYWPAESALAREVGRRKWCSR